MRIMLAEDTAELNRAVSAALEMQGYAVDSAFDGEEAMWHLMGESYDGVILDVMMPKKNGLEVLRELRGRHIVTPVLMLTAKSEIEDRVAGLDAGADDYLAKPFALRELMARVRSMIRRHDMYEGSALHCHDLCLESEGLVLVSRNSVRLSIKEFELMRTLILNRDIELTPTYLLEHIWKNESSAQADTVWLYINYLRGKLRSVGSNVSIAGDRTGGYQIRCTPEEVHA